MKFIAVQEVRAKSVNQLCLLGTDLVLGVDFTPYKSFEKFPNRILKQLHVVQ